MPQSLDQWVVALLLIIPFVGLIAFSLWLDARKTFRYKTAFLDSTTACTIDQAKDGTLVAVAGRVCDTSKLLEAPLTGRACVYFRSEALGASGSFTGDGRAWGGLKTVAGKTGRVDILIRDDTGTAYVSADTEVLVFAPPERRTMFQAGHDPGRERAFLGDCGIAAPQGWFQRWMDRSRGFDERILAVGDMAILAGVARWETGSDGKDARILRIVALPKEAMSPPWEEGVILNADPAALPLFARRRRNP